MRTIVISGVHSNIGKTSFAEEMLRIMPGWSAIKVTTSHKRGYLKESACPRNNRTCRACEDFKGDFELITARNIINQKNRDTARLKKAGAKRVVWLKARMGGLKSGLKKAFESLRSAEGVIIEGTSVLRYFKPDLAVFIKDSAKNGAATRRREAKEAEKRADIIVDISDNAR